MAGPMNAAIPDQSGRLATDARSLDLLKRTARSEPEAAVRQAARQFEALFMNMLMKSMREALPKEDMFASDATRITTGMLDDQWAQNLSVKGLGLADMMIKQLTKQQGGAEGVALLQKLQAANRAAGEPAMLQDRIGAPSAPSTLRRRGAVPPAAAAEASGGAALQPAVMAGTRKPLGAAAPATASAPVAIGSPQDFVRRMMVHATEAQKASGIPAHFVLGQAALESGWGRREIRAPDGSSTHNLFGIKAGRNWQGATVDAVTTEYVNGVPRKVVEKFRAYASYAEAFTDYASLLARSPRYAGAVEERGDAAAFASRIQAAGYATDPAYARKLTAVINRTLAMQGVA